MSTDKDYSATLIELDQETNKFRSVARYNQWDKARVNAFKINALSIELLDSANKNFMDMKK